MAITNGYCTLAELKASMGVTDTTDDSELEKAVEAASRFIDEYCGRHFFTTTSTRYFTASSSGLVYIDDLTSVTTLKTDEDGDRTYERTWSSSDYELEPYNAADTGKPYTEIWITPNGRYRFPSGRRGVEINGPWGWPSVPSTIHEACMTLARRLFRRRDAIFGVVGSADMGQQLVIPRVDPDVILLLKPYRKLTA